MKTSRSLNPSLPDHVWRTAPVKRLFSKSGSLEGWAKLHHRMRDFYHDCLLEGTTNEERMHHFSGFLQGLETIFRAAAQQAAEYYRETDNSALILVLVVEDSGCFPAISYSHIDMNFYH
jgi:hypothetical protein